MAEEKKSGGGGKKKAGKGEKGKTSAPAIPPRLRERYTREVVPNLRKQFDLKNIMAVPRLQKICLNMGAGSAATDNNPKLMEQCLSDLATITGQKAVPTTAKKSVSNFRLRQGMKIGAKVTLRGVRMWEFLDRLVNVAIPRIRDFRGLPPRSFDGRGNYSMGLQEQTVFPEVDPDKIEAIHGMDITICTSARDDEQARALLKDLGMPFRDR